MLYNIYALHVVNHEKYPLRQSLTEKQKSINAVMQSAIYDKPQINSFDSSLSIHTYACKFHVYFVSSLYKLRSNRFDFNVWSVRRQTKLIHRNSIATNTSALWVQRLIVVVAYISFLIRHLILQNQSNYIHR